MTTEVLDINLFRRHPNSTDVDFFELFTRAPNGMFVVYAPHANKAEESIKVLACNDKIIQATGITREQVDSGQVFLGDLMPPWYRANQSKTSDLASILLKVAASRNPLSLETKGSGVYANKIFRLKVWSIGHRLVASMWVDVTNEHAAKSSLRKSTVKLKEANEEIEQFLSLASHDLQEPLRTMSSFADILHNDYQEALDDTGRRYLSHIRDGALHMRDLIRDVLELGKAGRQDLKKEQVDLNQIARAVQHSLSLKIKERDAMVVFDKLPIVCGCKTSLYQVFLNLVGNAIKFANGRRPVVYVTVAETDSHFKFTVSDNGIGIKPQDSKKIFQAFKRLHPRSTYDGTGIGLSIVKKVVLLHEGDLGVESVYGQGSDFWFTLPKRFSDVKPL